MSSSNTAIRTFVARLRAELRQAIRSEKDFIDILLAIWTAAEMSREDLEANCSSQENKDEILAAYSQLDKLEQDGLRLPLSEVDTARQLMADANLEDICPEDWLGESFDELLAKGSVLLPQEVVELICELGEMSAGDTVYAPWDALGQVATWGARNGAEVRVKTPLRSRLLHVAKLFSCGNFEVEYGDPIRNSRPEAQVERTKFDVAIGFPPIGVNYKGVIFLGQSGHLMEDVSSSPTALGIAHLISHATRRTIAVVPTSFLSASGADERARALLLASGVVRTVIALPNGLFPATSLQISILVLQPFGEPSDVLFIDASGDDFYQKTSKARKQLANVKQIAEATQGKWANTNRPKWCKTASFDEISAIQSSLQVSRYVVDAAIARAKSQLANTETTTLNNLVSHVSPIPTSALRGSDCMSELVDVQEVGIQDLAPKGFSTTASRKVKLPKETIQSYSHLRLKPWDIVVVTKGSVGRVGLLSPHTFSRMTCFVAQSAVALRFRDPDEVAAKALFMLLRSPVGNQLLTSIVAGTTTPLIQLRALMQIKLPMLGAESRAQAAAMFDQEQAIQDEIDRLKEEQTALSKDFWAFAEGEELC